MAAGTGCVMADLIGGQIAVSVQSAPAVLPVIQSGRVRALSVMSVQRIPQLAAVPTVHETAHSGFEVSTWYGLCAPAATPVPVLEKVHSDLVAVLREPELRQRFREMVIDVAPMSREEFAQFIRAETARWARVIKEAGIPLQ